MIIIASPFGKERVEINYMEKDLLSWDSYGFFLNCRLQKIPLAKKSMLLSSTLRTFWVLQLHFSLTHSMIHTVMVPILSGVIHSVFGKVSQLLFLMASGLTSLTMMPPPSLWSLLRGIKGTFMPPALQIISSIWSYSLIISAFTIW